MDIEKSEFQITDKMTQAAIRAGYSEATAQ